MQPDSLWTNLSKEAIASRLEEQGTPASPKIVQQLLDLHDIGRRQAFKNVAMGQASLFIVLVTRPARRRAVLQQSNPR